MEALRPCCQFSHLCADDSHDQRHNIFRLAVHLSLYCEGDITGKPHWILVWPRNNLDQMLYKNIWSHVEQLKMVVWLQCCLSKIVWIDNIKKDSFHLGLIKLNNRLWLTWGINICLVIKQKVGHVCLQKHQFPNDNYELCSAVWMCKALPYLIRLLPRLTLSEAMLGIWIFYNRHLTL